METGEAPDTAASTPAAMALRPTRPSEPRRLSEEFGAILREFEVENVTLRDVMGRLHGRGYVLLVMLLALPFCTPIPLPGLSTPFGLVIAIIGVRLALGAHPWLPAKLLDTRLPPAVFAKVFAVTRKIVLAFERLLRPRLLWATASPRREQLHAVPIVINALLLLLPLPLPFSNTLPAWGILLLSGGRLERDGRFIIAGYATTLVAMVYIGLVGFLGVEVFDRVWRWFTA